MTLKDNKYNQIMEHVEVTDEMRTRILKNISLEISKNEGMSNAGEPITASKKKSKSKIAVFNKYLSVVAAAAVLLVIGIGIYSNQRVANQSSNSELASSFEEGTVAEMVEGDYLTTGIGLVEVKSLDELSEMLGFEFEELKNLPFDSYETVYIYLDTELGEIEYQSGNDSIVFRKSTGSGDNSGVFESFEKVEVFNLNGSEITLSGSDDGYKLLLWEDDEYSYSIYSTSAYDIEVWTLILEGIN